MMKKFLDRLQGLRVVVVGCMVLSVISGFAAFVMLVKYSEDSFSRALDLPATSIAPFVYLASSTVSLLILAAALDALYLIAENSKSIAIEISEVREKLNTIQTLEISEVRQKLNTIQTLSQNVDEISTSISEIADRVQEVELPVG